MGVKSPEIRSYGLVTIISIGTGIWIGLAAGPKWYWNALLAAIVLALSTFVLPLRSYQAYKFYRDELNKPIGKIRYLIFASLYSWAVMSSIGLIGRGIKSVFTWLTT